MYQDYKIYAPPIVLKDYIKYFWTLDVYSSEINKASFRSYADDRQGMSFQINSNKSVLIQNNEVIPLGFLHGFNTLPSIVQYLNNFSGFGVVFYPYGINDILGIDAYHFTDSLISIQDNIDAFLTEQILNAKNTTDRIDILSDFLLKRISSSRIKKRVEVSVSLINHINENHGMLTVRDIVLKYGLNERKLERMFKEQIGVAPRQFIKTVRFQRALKCLMSGKYTSLTEIAYDLNYADQSHFIRHVQQLSGLSPGALQKKFKESAVNIIV
ncbi:MAG TPA: hypothetical protein DCQ50_06110 [Chryseobacterium sp.]|nr:hypothetical protein [Chryseobacterium sp.]